VVSGTASLVRRYWQEIGLGLFWLANFIVLWHLTSWTTVPFHFIWVSLTIFYGFRVWGLRPTFFVLTIACVLTGMGLVHAAESHGGPGIDELTEIPLMSAMFLAMVWHAKRREDALAEVRRSAETERAFARDASHLLRTPIAVARGHADLIRDSHAGTETGDDAAVVLHELEQLSRISHRLLILAAAGHANFLRPEQIELEELVVDTARRWGATADRRWRVDVEAEGTLSVDVEQIGHALDALVENALRFTENGDAISITARAEGTRAVIEVADSGSGIPPDVRPFVFDRFHRARRAAGGGGAGLGLPLVRAIVEAHGGSVVTDDSPLGGALFRISLPGFEPGAPDSLLGAVREARRSARHKTVA
jgi:signal transduction histidine kinase